MPTIVAELEQKRPAPTYGQLHGAAARHSEHPSRQSPSADCVANTLPVIDADRAEAVSTHGTARLFCFGAAALSNAALLVVLSLINFADDRTDTTMVLYASTLQPRPSVVPESTPPVVISSPAELISKIEKPAAVQPVPIPEPLPQAARAAGAANESEQAASAPVRRFRDESESIAVATGNNESQLGNDGAAASDWTGWNDLAIGEGSGGNGETEFFGIAAFAERIVYVVDASGSMRGERFARAKTELIDSVESLGPLQSVAIIFFNDHRHTRVFPAQGGLKPVDDATKSALRLWADVIEPQGYTHPTRVIRSALRLSPDVIFFLSDGEIPVNTVRVATTDNEEVGAVMHTICFQSVEGHDLLKQLADENGGEYRFVE